MSLDRTIHDKSLMERHSCWVVRTNLSKSLHRQGDRVKFSTTMLDTSLQYLECFRHLSRGMHNLEAPAQSIVAL